jgi:hypothetical protein
MSVLVGCGKIRLINNTPFGILQMVLMPEKPEDVQKGRPARP